MKHCPLVQKNPSKVIDNLACPDPWNMLSGVLWRLDYGVEIFHQFLLLNFGWVRANAGTNFVISTGQLNSGWNRPWTFRMRCLF